MTASRLLKSCAIPPVSWPTASIFCDWVSALTLVLMAWLALARARAEEQALADLKREHAQGDDGLDREGDVDRIVADPAPGVEPLGLAGRCAGDVREPPGPEADERLGPDDPLLRAIRARPQGGAITRSSVARWAVGAAISA
jgi:hypothetical protein